MDIHQLITAVEERFSEIMKFLHAHRNAVETAKEIADKVLPKNVSEVADNALAETEKVIDSLDSLTGAESSQEAPPVQPPAPHTPADPPENTAPEALENTKPEHHENTPAEGENTQAPA